MGIQGMEMRPLLDCLTDDSCETGNMVCAWTPAGVHDLFAAQGFGTPRDSSSLAASRACKSSSIIRRHHATSIPNVPSAFSIALFPLFTSGHSFWKSAPRSFLWNSCILRRLAAHRSSGN